VRVDAVRLTDLDVDEPGVAERPPELVLGERAGDAARPLGDVGAWRRPWEWRDFWIYVVGPLTGVALGAGAQFIRTPPAA
jgi:hypothetical protein